MSKGFTPWVRHILNDGKTGDQHCIMCGVQVAPHMLGPLPSGEVFEHDGRLALIRPLGNVVHCTDLVAAGNS